jgi:glycosyltransferase involved in cell wall biosynthesis
MNILLINHYAGSPNHGMEYRPFYMAREWVKMGHQVTIVGASHSHLRSRQPDISGEIAEQNMEGIRYIWLKTRTYSGNGIGRIINMLMFLIQLFKFNNYIAKEYKPDVVIASSTYPLDIYPASYIARENKAKLVYEVHDLWPLSPIELGGMSPWHPFIMVMQMAENFAYRKCDRIVSMLPKAERHMRQHGMEPHKFSYVPNGIDAAEWEYSNALMPEQHRTVLEELRNSGNFIVGYAGAHGVANALYSLVEAASLLKDESVTIVLVGQGQEKEKLKAIVKEQKINNIVFLPAVAKNAIPEILNNIDVLYIGLQKQSLFRFGVSPNKLMDYMMSARPVIHAIDAGNDLVAESGCGISIPPQNPKAIAGAISKLKLLSQAERDDMGLKGRKFVLANHDYRALAKKFIDIINE